MSDPMTETHEPPKDAPLPSPEQAATPPDAHQPCPPATTPDLTPRSSRDSATPAARQHGRFTILKPHARGGLGQISVARDEDLKRQVALKEIRPDRLDCPQAAERFVNEAEITGQLEHPGIVPIYALGRDEAGRPYYAMRFIEGHTLADAIKEYHRQPSLLAFRDLLKRFVDICQTLAYAHSKKVIHRDLKPSNIMVGDYGETLVLDWGLAKRLGGASEASADTEPGLPLSSGPSTTNARLTQAGQVLGTPAYMAPEQAEGQADLVGAAADIYALGAILYELLTNQAPYGERPAAEIIAEVRQGPPLPPTKVRRGVPPALAAVCLKAMARSSTDRYPTAADLARDVERWLADEPVTAYPEPLTRRLARWRRRNSTLVAAVTALLLTALGALTVGTVVVGRTQARTRALAQVEALREANPQAVPLLLNHLRDSRGEVLPRLRELWEGELPDGQRRRIGLALLPTGAGVGADTVRGRLVELMLAADDPQELLLVRDALQSHGAAELRADLWSAADSPTTDSDRRFRVLVGLAALDPDNAAWGRAGGGLTEQFLAANPLQFGVWKKALEPVRLALVPSLEKVFRDHREPDRGLLAASVLADYAADQPAVLAELVLEADAKQHFLVWPRLREHAEKASALMHRELSKTMPPEEQVQARDRLARRQARAAVALFQLGQTEPVWPLLRHSADPSRRSFLLHALGWLRSDCGPLLRRLETETDVGVRRALILSLGEFDQRQLPAEQRQAAVRRLLGWYREDSDPGIHAAVDWLMRHPRQGQAARKLDWGQGQELSRIDRELRGQQPARRESRDPFWYVDKQGQTMVAIPGPVEFLMGSPAYEQGRDATWERLHLRRIPRSFAVATREVTVAEFRRFLEAHPKIKGQFQADLPRYSPDADGPIIGVTWFEAAQYCNWLSKEEGIPESEWCYPAVAKIGAGMELPGDYLHRTGYRLPTEAEWEFACRAGARTSRFFGSSEELLKEYAWYSEAVLGVRAWPCGQLKPNDLGLFDIYGNVSEWCQDRVLAYQSAGDQPVEDVEDEAVKVLAEQRRIRRGTSFGYTAALEVRSAGRSATEPARRSDSGGFRVARTYR
jgi:serine/threonine protein kinase/formylglycine-generating enzyme required for sulfatase activity